MRSTKRRKGRRSYDVELPKLPPTNVLSKMGFVRSHRDLKDLGPPLAEIAFAGRSNVGKSSLLNALSGNRTPNSRGTVGIASVANKPGVHAAINVYKNPSGAQLVDLPGYGFAFGAEEELKLWQESMRGYLARSGAPLRVLLLIDARQSLRQSDRDFLLWLDRENQGADARGHEQVRPRRTQGAREALHDARRRAAQAAAAPPRDAAPHGLVEDDGRHRAAARGALRDCPTASPNEPSRSPAAAAVGGGAGRTGGGRRTSTRSRRPPRDRLPRRPLCARRRRSGSTPVPRKRGAELAREQAASAISGAAGRDKGGVGERHVARAHRAPARGRGRCVRGSS